jgi:transposase
VLWSLNLGIVRRNPTTQAEILQASFASIKTLATTSQGEKLENPRPLVRREKRLKGLQRRLSRKVNGGANRKKARHKVAKLHAKISDTRRDAIQNVAYWMTCP